MNKEDQIVQIQIMDVISFLKKKGWERRREISADLKFRIDNAGVSISILTVSNEDID